MYQLNVWNWHIFFHPSDVWELVPRNDSIILGMGARCQDNVDYSQKMVSIKN